MMPYFEDFIIIPAASFSGMIKSTLALKVPHFEGGGREFPSFIFQLMTEIPVISRDADHNGIY